MLKNSMAALTAALMMSAATPGAAAVLIVNASGTFSGNDTNNLLGLHGPSDTVQAPFTLMFSFDLDLAIREDQGGTDVFFAGLNHRRPAQAVAAFTVGSLAFSLLANSQATALQNNRVLQQWVHRIGGGGFYVGAQDDNLNPLADATTPAAGNICLIATCYGFLDSGLGVSGDLAAEVYTVTYDPNAVGAIPEPASWALMIGGLGLAGAALRRRRAAPDVTPIS